MIPEIIIMEHRRAENPGEFMFWPMWPNRALSYVNCIKCNKNILISTNHTVTINADATITIHPSIIHDSCGAHFWIKENKIITDEVKH